LKSGNRIGLEASTRPRAEGTVIRMVWDNRRTLRAVTKSLDRGPLRKADAAGYGTV
jgi:hypothetical protein